MFVSNFAFAQHLSTVEAQALGIQKMMVNREFGSGKKCNGNYDKNAGTVDSLIRQMDRLSRDKDASSGSHERFAYLLSLKAKCDTSLGMKDRMKMMDRALDQAQIALKKDSTNTKAIALVAITVKGLNSMKGLMSFKAKKKAKEIHKKFYWDYVRYFRDYKGEKGKMYTTINDSYKSMLNS